MRQPAAAAMKPWVALAILLVAGPVGAQTLQESVTTVWVHDVPGPPQGDFWDPVAAHLLSMFTNPASVYPDVMVCARPSQSATPHCSSICWDLKGDSHGNGQPSTECQRPLHVSLVPNDPRMVLDVLEMDRDGDRARVHAVIARNVVVSDPSRCTDEQPCRWNSAKGALVLSFSTQIHGVAGTPAPYSPSTAPTQGGGSGAPFTNSPLWQQTVTGAKKAGKVAREVAEKAAKQYVQSKNPTAFENDTVQRAVAANQAAVNRCVLDIAEGNDTFRARMPLCVNKSGQDLEGCLTQKVLGDDPSAVDQAANCSRRVQGEIQDLGRSAAYTWLKGQMCGIGQWVGLRVCQE